MLEYYKCTIPYQQSSSQDVLHHMTLQIVLVWVGCYLIQCTLPPGAHKRQLVMSYLHQMIICICVWVCMFVHECVTDIQVQTYAGTNIQNTHKHMHIDNISYIIHIHGHTCMHVCTRAHTHTHTT